MLVPTSIVENTYEPFPEGTYMGTYSDFSIRDNADGSWMALDLTFTDIQPADDTSPEDGRPFTGSVTIRVKDVSLVDVDDVSSLPRELFALRLGAGLLGGLALAFGEAHETDEGVDFDLENFISKLQNGAMQGKQAAFVTKHKKRSGTYIDQDGEERERKGVDVNVMRFMPVGL